MSIIIFLALALFFSWAFSEQKDREVKAMDQCLKNERSDREKERNVYRHDKMRLKNTIKELL